MGVGSLLDHVLFAVVFGLAMMAVGACVAHVLHDEQLGAADEKGWSKAALVDVVTLSAIAACWVFQACVSGAARLAMERVCGARSHSKAGEPVDTQGQSRFGTRPFRQGDTPMCAVCCATPGNAFAIWQKDFGSGLAKRFGVPGDHLGANETF